MRLPEKDYLTFDELAEKWKCSSRDLFHLIATLKIIPSIFLSGKFEMLTAKLDCTHGELNIYPLSDFNSGASMRAAYVNEICYLAWGCRSIGVSNRYVFPYASENREIAEFSIVYPLEQGIAIEYNQVANEVHTSDYVFFLREEILYFEHKYMQSAIKTEPPSNQAAYPWGSHNTNLLTQLSNAAVKFWSLYDPSDASTAPTNEQVEKWLIEQSVSPRTAEAMATILRADGLKTGRRG